MKTLPTGYFLVDGPENFMAMITKMLALPNLEQVSLEYVGGGSVSHTDSSEYEDEEVRERDKDEVQREYPLHDEEEWFMMTSSQDHELRGRVYSLLSPIC